MHRWLCLSLALLTGCPKSDSSTGSEPLGDSILVELPDMGQPPMCISLVPQAGAIKKADRAHLQRAVGFVQEGRTMAALTALNQATPHPAVKSVQAASLVLSGKPDDAMVLYSQLQAAWPNDTCLQTGAALAMGLLGDSSAGDVAFGAWETSNNPDDGLLAALLYLQSSPKTANETLLAVSEAHPDHARTAYTLGVLKLEGGDVEPGLALLETARTAGLKVGPQLLDAQFYSGATEAYLRTASTMGLPVGDHGRIATAEDVMATYFEELGIPEEPVVVMTTTMGELRCELLPQEAPVTVGNFVGLAKGLIEWTHPVTGEVSEKPLYDGTVFHRVIPQFMIQGGDPQGTGTGSPGYRFRDEITRRTFDKPGLLAMANSGPATNGSQFFITEVPTPHLDGKHTIFGVCDSNTLEVVKKMTSAPRGAMDVPETPIVLKTVRFEAKPPPPPPAPPFEATRPKNAPEAGEPEGAEPPAAPTKVGPAE